MSGSDMATEMANNAYLDARKARAHAVSLESEPNAAAACKAWHLVADALHEAAALIDAMQIKGATA